MQEVQLRTVDPCGAGLLPNKPWALRLEEHLGPGLLLLISNYAEAMVHISHTCQLQHKLWPSFVDAAPRKGQWVPMLSL